MAVKKAGDLVVPLVADLVGQTAANWAATKAWTVVEAKVGCWAGRMVV